MISLYSADEVRKLSRRQRFGRTFCLTVSVLTLAACVILCLRVRTGNAARLQWTAAGIFLLGGWAVILCRRLVSSPSKAMRAHCESMLSGEVTDYEGILKISDLSFHIPRGVTARRVRLTGGADDAAFSVEESRLGALLPADGRPVRVQAVRNFILSFEVRHEED